MSYGLFICATLILPITAVNKNQVPYAVHLILTLLSVQKQTCSYGLIMVLNCSVGMVLWLLSLNDKNSFDLESVVKVPYLQDNLSENISVLVNMPLAL